LLLFISLVSAPELPRAAEAASPRRLAGSYCGERARGDRREADGGEPESVNMNGNELPSAERRLRQLAKEILVVVEELKKMVNERG
jgi:hypothetical protein